MAKINNTASSKNRVEIIFEFRWPDSLASRAQYKIVLAKIIDDLSKEYPIFEAQEASNIPDEMAFGLVQYRFRKKKEDWPLAQIGPGVLAINESSRYVWKDFNKRILDVVSILTKHISIDKLGSARLVLKAVGAVDFDYNKQDVLSFLHKNIGVNIEPNAKFLKNKRLGNPNGFDLNLLYKNASKRTNYRLRFGKGSHKGVSSLLWSMDCVSEYISLTDTYLKEINSWLDEAHLEINNWEKEIKF
jgi:uncharacterized protein (TIGR04255 family)